MKINELVTRWIRPEVREIAAYHVPEPGGMVKLDAMENPYHWPQVNPDLQSQLSLENINRYPDASGAKVKQALRTAFKIDADYEILLGNGSDELIQMIAMAVSANDRVIMAPEPGFVMYKMIALMCGMRYEGVSLNADFTLNMDAMLEAIEKHEPAVIFIAYPNNPTGNLFDINAIETILKKSNGLVVVDEAYYAFAESSMISKLGQYENLIIMRTVSKMGLAGLRLGYLVGRKEWVAEFDKMRLPYNINVLTQQTACVALENIEKFNEQTNQIIKDRQLLMESLLKIEGIDVFPSQANFILFRVNKRSAAEVFGSLRNQRVLIKNLGAQLGLLQNCLRVTVGTPEENEAFLVALKHSLQ